MSNTNPLQLSFQLDRPHHNQYLFSDHYLVHLLPQDGRWQDGLTQAQTFLTWLRGHYAQKADQLPYYTEDQLEYHWFEPIFRELGHVFEPKASIPGLDKGIKRPDYVFFPDEATRQTAVASQKTADYAAHALAVGEVKAWEVPLGKKVPGGGPSFDQQNPSYQLDYYLKSTGLTWGVLSNGRSWRLIHRDTSHRLTIYYEVDLFRLLEQGDPGPLRYFTAFFHQAAFRPDTQGRVFLDDVLAASRAYAVQLEEDLQENVYQALEQLMQGFLDLPQNGLNTADLPAIYTHSLHLLYRLLFIFYAESRGLLPLANPLYRDHYSLQDMKTDIAQGNAPTLPMTIIFWARLKTLFQIINGDNETLNRQLGVPRYNGGLFDPALHPFLEQKAVGDRALVTAVDLLSRRRTERGMEFVDYRTLGVRQLGSIYEGLLEYQPRLAQTAMAAVRQGKEEKWLPTAEISPKTPVMARREAGQIYLVTDKGERKATGSYYTPAYIVEYIVENTLGPLVEEATARVKARAQTGKTTAEKAQIGRSLVEELLNLKVLDPAMGSGHFLVAATDYLAVALATDPYVQREDLTSAVAGVPTEPQLARSGDRPEQDMEEDITYWRRRVVERCIYGVDKNPLAVELAKLSLWLATVAADRPLSFLDHHLKCGDSLIGARVADLGWAPPAVLGKKALKQMEQQRAGQMNLFAYRLGQQLPVVMGKVLEIVGRESDSYETVQAKEAADEAVRQLKAPFEAVADLWTSAWFGHAYTPNDYGEALEAMGTERLWGLPAIAGARDQAAARGFFHWELAFPEVFYDKNGRSLEETAGFDAVIGNPPWVNIGREPGQEAMVNFVKHSYTCAEYQVDLYVLFLELGIHLLHPKHFLAMIAPDPWLANYRTPRIRKLLLVQNQPLQIVHTPRSAFPNVGAEHLILVVKSGENCKQPLKRGSLDEFGNVQINDEFPCELITEQNAYVVYSTSNFSSILKKIESSSQELGEIFETVRGVGPYHHKKHSPQIITARQFHSNYQKDGSFVPELKGEHLSRYQTSWDGNSWISYGPWLAEPREKRFFQGKRLLLREILGKQFMVSILEEDFIVDRSIYIALQGTHKLNLHYVLAVLASNLLIFWFREKFSENDELFPKLRMAHFNMLPIRQIDFTTLEEKRERLAEKGRKLYEQFCQKEDYACVLGFVDHHLGQTPEQTDVAHDLLAFLAEQMIAMNREKQALTADFWLDLEGTTEAATFAALRGKGKQEASLWKEGGIRPFVNSESHSSRALDDSLGWNEEAFKGFVRLLAGPVPQLSQMVKVYRHYHPRAHALITRLAHTDRLIDQVVYRLYGLTEEEIALIEGQ